MISASIAIVEKLVKLVEVRGTNRRNLFIDHIEPMFLDMTAIHADYRKGFRAAISLLEDHRMLFQRDEASKNVGMGILEDDLRDRQQNLLHLREKVQILLGAWDGSERLKKIDDDAADFLDRCARYLERQTHTDAELYNAHYTAAIKLLRAERGRAGSDEEWPYRRRFQAAYGIIESERDQLEHNWGNVTEAYARARINLLK